MGCRVRINTAFQGYKKIPLHPNNPFFIREPGISRGRGGGVCPSFVPFFFKILGKEGEGEELRWMCYLPPSARNFAPRIIGGNFFMLFYLQAERGIPPKTPFFPFLWHATRNSCRRKKLCNWGLLGSSWLG